MHSHPSAIVTPVTEVGVYRLPGWKVSGQCPPTTPFTKDVENGVKDVPHLDFTRTTTGFGTRDHLAQQFKLVASQVTGISFTHLALSVLSTTYSQRTPSELFYALTDF